MFFQRLIKGATMVALCTLASLLGLAGAVVVPAHAFFLRFWMHAPLDYVLLSTVPPAIVLLAAAWWCGQCAMRRRDRNPG